MLLWSCFILASLSCIVATAAIWSCVRVRKLLAGASARSLALLSTEVAELTSAYELLSRQQRRLSQRVGMREAREKKHEGEDDQVEGDRVSRLNKLREIARAKGFRL